MSATIVQREQIGADVAIRVEVGSRTFEVLLCPVNEPHHPAGYARMIVPIPSRSLNLDDAIAAALADIEAIAGATVVLLPVGGVVNAC